MVWQVGQDSLLLVLASTLQLWFLLNLLLVFVRILGCFCFFEEIFYVAQHVLEVWQFGQVG